MIDVRPAVLEGRGIRLEPLTDDHHDALAAAAADGRLWELWFTAGPGARRHARPTSPTALKGQRDGHMLPWVGARLGERRDHRLHALSRHRSRRSIAWRSATPGTRRAGSAPTSTPPASCCCSRHAFDTLGCKVVGLRTDNFNFRSQRAIEALGAKKDGVIRHHAAPRRHACATR